MEGGWESVNYPIIIEMKVLRTSVILIDLLKCSSQNSLQKHHVPKKSFNKHQDLLCIGH